MSGDGWMLTVNLFLVYHTEAAWVLGHDVNDDPDEDADCEEGVIIYVKVSNQSTSYVFV